MRLEVGDIILVKPYSLISRIIAFFTKSDYSHTAIVYDIDDPVLIIDTDWIYTKIRPLKYYEDKGYNVYRVKEGLNKEDKLVIKQLMRHNLDKQYDYIQLISYLNRLVFKVNKIVNNPDKFVCSEMVDFFYNNIGIDLVSRYKNGNVTPEEISNSNILNKVSE